MRLATCANTPNGPMVQTFDAQPAGRQSEVLARLGDSEQALRPKVGAAHSDQMVASNYAI
jgi:hypothetical protein